MNIIYFIRSVVQGFYSLVEKTLIWAYHHFRRLPIYEKVFLAITAILLFLLIAPWMSYTITFDSEITKGIPSDDFLLYVIFIVLAISASFVHLSHDDSGTIAKLAFIIRISSTMVITVLYLMTLLDDSRISASEEASYTIYFFLFGISVFLLWIFGYLGIKSMPSTQVY